MSILEHLVTEEGSRAGEKGRDTEHRCASAVFLKEGLELEKIQ